VTTRAEFVSAVRGYVGSPFHHQGRLPGVGMDCPAIIICALWRFGIWPRSKDVTGYPRIPDGHSIKAYCDEHLTPIAEDAMRAADVVLVRWSGGPPQHLGVLFNYPHGGLAMVHADSVTRKAVCEQRVKFGRAMGLVAAYSVPGLVD
jgi:hypothetical protein